MQVEFPIQCACGLENRVFEDMPRRKIIIECRCGTRLSIDKDEWFYMSHVQMAREMKRCKWNGRNE